MCDDGNDVPGDGCTPGCTYVPGEVAWTVTIDDAWVDMVDVAVDATGRTIVALSILTESTFEDPMATVLVAYGPDGERLWNRQWNFEPKDAERPAAIATDAGGDIYLAGHTPSAVFARKYSRDGELKWETLVPRGGDDRLVARDIVVADGGVFVLTDDGTGLNQDEHNVCVLRRLDAATGGMVWAMEPSTMNIVFCNGLAHDGSQIIVAGGADWSPTSPLVVAVDLDGAQRWSLFDPEIAGSWLAAGASPQGNVVLTGFAAAGDHADHRVAAFNSDGTPLWADIIGTTSSDNSAKASVLVDAEGRALVAITIREVDDPWGLYGSFSRHNATGGLLWTTEFRAESELLINAAAAGPHFAVAVGRILPHVGWVRRYNLE
ncbi:MAG: PQQ-binding-like beta-propeller repeat protein [Nannocystis sp.]|nr:PQQ-binding-like beta-propeller repeat protein [Nannocystis sp.]MBK9756385.1 PQQ-binding-like beta-propeller repeat protein [Nannocystis sp.]